MLIMLTLPILKMFQKGQLRTGIPQPGSQGLQPDTSEPHLVLWILWKPLRGSFRISTFIHISGYKSNSKNFGNLFGAMETMKYLAGMLAGARAKQDNNPKLGYMATFPIPEELRLGNAFALGMRKTCPECTIDVRWINTWHDPIVKKKRPPHCSTPVLRWCLPVQILPLLRM